ncbi:hypothetical protein [Streptomyces smyrnaeus]|uniref:hypothetical protein n=1 Tax=Streptomyces smyrnaeus TaxID=1387713 RepID=UPI00369950F6
MRSAIAALFEEDTPEEQFIRLSRLLNVWPEVHREVRRLRQDVANELHDSGMTYDAIGGLIDVTESRARHIAKGIVSPSREKSKADREATEPRQ